MSTEKALSKRFEINKDLFSHHYDINKEDGAPLHYVDLSVFSRNKPDLILHNGPSASAPVIAEAHIERFSGHFKIGVGDPARPDAVQWEELHREKVDASEYRFSTDLGSDERRNFVWKRTRSVGVDGRQPSALSSRNWKLLNEAGELLAVFSSTHAISKCGTLQINVDYGRDFEALVLISCLSLYERSRRRRARAGAAGGSS